MNLLYPCSVIVIFHGGYSAIHHHYVSQTIAQALGQLMYFKWTERAISNQPQIKANFAMVVVRGCFLGQRGSPHDFAMPKMGSDGCVLAGPLWR